MADTFRVMALLAGAGSVLLLALNMRAISRRLGSERPRWVRRVRWVTVCMTAGHLALGVEIASRMGRPLTWRTPAYSGVFLLTIFAIGSWYREERQLEMTIRLREISAPDAPPG